MHNGLLVSFLGRENKVVATYRKEKRKKKKKTFTFLFLGLFINNLKYLVYLLRYFLGFEGF